ncbi:MAG: DNA-binding response regulator [Actinobacteria bacterium]|nr:DNA-binding response regulator [Actinomycetota bacterium]NCV97601.1 DNA-binding response regulator [Acidimicrobiia bacterium]NBS35946.1 DNA-binding response regulator [Actinomycetota bacterium]NCX18535.1 DNA-binding response regulator [Acidimicrobiia bacterium]NCX60973.1 DNA-binding response regulator [Actinomycetota bacterium]
MKSHGWRVLVAEDDAAVRSAVVRVLELDGYRVQAVKDGRAALDALIDATPDAAVLDVMMPFVDGFTVCREIRHRGNRVPILLLTAKVEVDDRVAGLDAGADDYLVKPFAIAELSARVRALLRRNAVPESGADVTVGSISLNRDTRNVERNGRRIELTKTEFNLLELLADQAGLVVSRETIYENVWGYNFETNSKSLDVYVGYLRRKLSVNDEPDPIRTVRGVGYCLESR